MRKVLVIGIGAGDPEYVTIQAVKALNTVDVFFLIDKGATKDSLVALRRDICERYIEPGREYRFVQARDPERDRSAAAYESAVQDWLGQRTEIFEQMIGGELGEDGVGAFLVWGDPALYDGTLRIIDRIRARGVVDFDHEVIPGITSVQALTARHRIPLNRIAEPIHITTGRRLAEGLPDGVDNAVVMLDGDCAFQTLEGEDVDLYWGAYLGTPDEVLMRADLAGGAQDVVRERARLREQHGWIMDTYLLRRRTADPER